MIADFEHCCACRACEAACPTKAISFKLSDDSFVYPQIDSTKCIDCKKCEKVCDFIKEKNNECNIISAYGFKYNDLDVLKNSTSGGAFTAISDYILRQNGVVFGAVMKDDITVCHEIAFDSTKRDKMRGSKYVQSDMNGVYEKIKEHLQNDKLVMFTGTPCQTAGVKSFFGGKYNNLILVDFLCHGVNSNKMLLEHIRMLEKKLKKNITSYEFRPKDLTWNPSAAASVSFSNKSKKEFFADAQVLFDIFTSNSFLRPSCYNCKYRTQHRYSDITIADFWGYKKFYNSDDKTGLSLLFANSRVGMSIIENIKDYGEVKSIPLSDIIHRIALTPPEKNKNYDKLNDDYIKNGYEYCAEKYFPISTKYRLRFLAKKIIRKYEAKKNKMV